MNCIAPEEIEEGTLIAYIENDASEQVINHIVRCPFCRKEVQEIKRTEALLKLAFWLNKHAADNVY